MQVAYQVDKETLGVTLSHNRMFPIASCHVSTALECGELTLDARVCHATKGLEMAAFAELLFFPMAG